jgi:hypothetical protein
VETNRLGQYSYEVESKLYRPNEEFITLHIIVRSIQVYVLVVLCCVRTWMVLQGV